MEKNSIARMAEWLVFYEDLGHFPMEITTLGLKMHHVCLIQSISARKATHIKLGTRSGSSQCQLHFGTKMVSIG